MSKTIIDYSQSQLPLSDDYLYYDEEPACALHADRFSVEDSEAVVMQDATVQVPVDDLLYVGP